MLEQFRYRSLELEHLDKGDYSAQEYEDCIVELQLVNRWLGDARALRQSLLKEIERIDPENFSVLDVGAGSGELLQQVADWASDTGRKARVTGLEINARSAKAIKDRQLSSAGPDAVRADALQLPFSDQSFDYVICSLFTHHFKDSDVVHILQEQGRVARRRLYVIDLHRHPVAYFLFALISRIFFHNRLIREDGALSIRRSFKPAELIKLAERAKLEEIKVERKFPFRLVLTATPSTELN